MSAEAFYELRDLSVIFVLPIYPMKKLRIKAKEIDIEKVDAFNRFGCTHKFFNSRTGLCDTTYFIMVGDQVTINPKCEASYADLMTAWNIANK